MKPSLLGVALVCIASFHVHPEDINVPSGSTLTIDTYVDGNVSVESEATLNVVNGGTVTGSVSGSNANVNAIGDTINSGLYSIWDDFTTSQSTVNIGGNIQISGDSTTGNAVEVQSTCTSSNPFGHIAA